MEVLDDLAFVMTASIDPKGMKFVPQPDPRERERDYAGTLRFYLSNFPRVRRIVFAENSGWNLASLTSIARSLRHGKELEFISLECNDFPRELGKSYGEMLMLDKVRQRSTLIAKSGYFAKITGRNYLLNADQIVLRARQPFGLLCDLRDHNIYDLLKINACGHHCDTRFLVFSKDFYDRELLGRHELMNESAGYPIERFFYELCKKPGIQHELRCRFDLEPEFRGLAGHYRSAGQVRDYGSLRDSLKRRVRGAVRRIFPRLYL